MDILNFIVEEGYIMIPVLFILGEFIKRTKAFNADLIPVYLLSVSIILTPAVIGSYNADNVVQGILVTGVAVLGYEAVKGGKKYLKDSE